MGAPIKTRRKKTETPVAAEAAVVEVPAVPTQLRVSLHDLWEMRLAQADKRAAEAESEAARMSRLYALSKLDPKGIVLGIERKQEVAKKQVEAAENRALLAKKRMEGAIGRPLTGLAIDPDTGEVQIP